MQYMQMHAVLLPDANDFTRAAMCRKGNDQPPMLRNYDG
jgi:hypothetical protein